MYSSETDNVYVSSGFMCNDCGFVSHWYPYVSTDKYKIVEDIFGQSNELASICFQIAQWYLITCSKIFSIFPRSLTSWVTCKGIHSGHWCIAWISYRFHKLKFCGKPSLETLYIMWQVASLSYFLWRILTFQLTIRIISHCGFGEVPIYQILLKGRSHLWF